MTDPDHELVMPFTCVHSVGGPYDDTAFIAGYLAGRFDMALALNRGPTRLLAPPELVAQLDLIAMRHGRATRATPLDENWTEVVALPARPSNGTDR